VFVEVPKSTNNSNNIVVAVVGTVAFTVGVYS
jgi:hypothetical protein